MARQYFEVVRPHIPETLISKVAFDRVLDTAAAIPGSCAHSCSFIECALTGESRADIAFQLLPDGNWIDDLEDCPVPADAEPGSWKTWQAFGTDWRPGVIDYVFAEFDASGAKRRTPCLFWRFRPGSTRAEQIRGIGQVLSTPQAETIVRVLRDLPGEWNIREVGLMQSRPDAPARLALRAPAGRMRADVTRLTPATVNETRVVQMIDLLSRHFEDVRFNLDITDRLEPPVGLEFLSPVVDTGWTDVLETMADAGLAAPARVEAALAYRGATSPLINAEFCPPSILTRWSSGSFAETPYLVRDISHVKVVIPADGVPLAKIYLTVTPYWKSQPQVSRVNEDSFL